MAEKNGSADTVDTAKGQSLAIPADSKVAAAFVAQLFRTKAIYDPSLTFINAPMSAEDKAQAAEMIHAARHEAGSLEEMLEGGKLVAGKDFVNRPFKIANVKWRGSDIAGEGLPIYAILDLVLADGTIKTIGTGAASSVEAIAIGEAQGWFGVEPEKDWLKFVAIELTDDTGKKTGRTAVELHTAGDLAPF